MSRFTPLPARLGWSRRGRTLVETMVALGVFATATLGIWETIRTVFFLSAKNTGLNLSHTALQSGVDRMTEQLRGALQIVDVANFDGTTFTHLDESATSAGPTTAGNAVRFLRCIPISVFVNSDGKTYTMSSPEASRDSQNPDDYLKVGNTSVKGTCDATQAAAAKADPSVVADLTNARLLPRFPYLTEAVTAGSCSGSTLPGLDLNGSPTISGSNVTLSLMNGWPATPRVPSCNLAYLGIVSAIVVLNRGTAYAEMIYYPDAMNLSRKDSLTLALAASTTGSGPLAFVLPKNAGRLDDPSARGSLQVSLPVYAPYLGNSVVRRGGTAALVNVELNLPVEARRRAQF